MISAIQVGRAIAAIAVCAFHLSIGFGDDRYAGHMVFRSFTSRGDMGVDFFFVLSGFIMMLVHHSDIGRTGAWVPYAKKRIIRLLPIYWIYTAAFCLLLMMGFGQVTKLPSDVWQWLSTILLVRFDSGMTPLAPAWTLFHEVFFYFIFGALIFSRRLGVVLITLWVFGCFVNYQYAAVEQRSAINTYFSAYNIEFLVGMMAHAAWRLFSTLPDARAIGVASIVASGAVLFLVATFEGGVDSPSGLRAFYGLSFGLLLFGATMLETSGWEFRSPTLTLLGDSSYSIYLTHEAFMGVLLKIVFKTGLYMRVGDGLSYIIVLGAAVLLGVLAFLWVERPMLRLIRRRVHFSE